MKVKFPQIGQISIFIMLKNIILCKSIVNVSFESSHYWSSPTDSKQDSIIVWLSRNQVLFSIYHVITTKNAGFATSFSDMVRFAYRLLIDFSNCNVMEFESSDKKLLVPQNIDRLLWDLENNTLFSITINLVVVLQ